jgi:hypothetical protein
MMPLPGFQKPTPYFAPAVDRKLYTSAFTFLAWLRSASAPNEFSLRGLLLQGEDGERM